MKQTIGACALLTAALVATSAVCPQAQAAVVASRAALQIIMGGPGTLETFDNFAIAPAGSTFVDCNPLSSTATCNGQGPGIVVPGFSISQTVAIAWNGPNYGPALTPTIRGFNVNALGGELTITFAQAAGAVGMDVAAIGGYPDTGTVSFYGADQTTLLGTIGPVALLTTGAFRFAGWADSGGIGRLTLSGAAHMWSPLLDNLEFAAVAAPEPASLALLAGGVALLGLARRRA